MVHDMSLTKLILSSIDSCFQLCRLTLFSVVLTATVACIVTNWLGRQQSRAVEFKPQCWHFRPNKHEDENQSATMPSEDYSDRHRLKYNHWSAKSALLMCLIFWARSCHGIKTKLLPFMAKNQLIFPILTSLSNYCFQNVLDWSVNCSVSFIGAKGWFHLEGSIPS